VDSASILHEVHDCAGDPHAVVHALIDAAKAAGGKDNITVVYAEGGTFAMNAPSRLPGTNGHLVPGTPREGSQPSQPASVPIAGSGRSGLPRQLGLIGAIIVSLVMTGFIVYRTAPLSLPSAPLVDFPTLNQPAQIVRPGESIATALSLARPGSEVVVEPGEYHERITLNDNVRLRSRIPRGATIRLPAATSDAQPEPAIIATGSAGGELAGFRIIGDARSPLGIGILVAGSGLSIVDVDISGAATAAISFARDASATLVGSEIRDNPGAALTIAAGATPRITHSVFGRNGMSPRTPATFVIEKGAMPLFQRNVFLGIRPDVFATMEEAPRLALARDNWFH
jgi:hypothetical protein